MSIYQKLQQARVELQSIDIKKSGNNKFAGYTYMELSDFMPAVNTIFNNIGLCGVVSFTTDIATLTVHDVAKPDDAITFSSPMSSAALKGCHDVQNLGAVQTYLRRYLYINCMELVEHDALDGTLGKRDGIEEKKVIKSESSNLDAKIVADLNAADTLKGLAAVWSKIDVGVRHEYTKVKDARKAKLSEGENAKVD